MVTVKDLQFRLDAVADNRLAADVEAAFAAVAKLSFQGAETQFKNDSGYAADVSYVLRKLRELALKHLRQSYRNAESEQFIKKLNEIELQVDRLLGEVGGGQ